MRPFCDSITGRARAVGGGVSILPHIAGDTPAWTRPTSFFYPAPHNNRSVYVTAFIVKQRAFERSAFWRFGKDGWAPYLLIWGCCVARTATRQKILKRRARPFFIIAGNKEGQTESSFKLARLLGLPGRVSTEYNWGRFLAPIGLRLCGHTPNRILSGSFGKILVISGDSRAGNLKFRGGVFPSCML